MFPISSLSHFVRCLKTVPDPRSKQGQSHPFRTILAIVVLGLIGNITTLAEGDDSLQTGDALYAQRSLLKSLHKHHRDYLVQVKENQPKVYAKLQKTYEHVRHQKPDHVLPRKKRGFQKLVVSG